MTRTRVTNKSLARNYIDPVLPAVSQPTYVHFSSEASMTSAEQLRDRIGQVDSGELTDIPPAWGYAVVFPSARSRAFIYTTKAHAASQLLASADHEIPVGLIGRYGLPRDEDVSGIARIIRGYPVYFLNDCDPFDLLVFAWLREQLPIRFLGTSDAVVSALGVEVTEWITIALPDEEQRAMSLVREVWPDFAKCVGVDCARLLDSNRKLELEALVSFHTKPAGDLLDLLRETA